MSSYEDVEDDWDEEDVDDDAVTVPCPYCRREVYEDAERCPYCERYISDEDAPARQKSWWVVVGAVICLVVVLWWIVAG